MWYAVFCCSWGEGISAMKRKLGVFLVILGSVLIFGALGLFLYNYREQEQAAEVSAAVMPQIVEVIHQRQEEQKEEFEPVHQYVEERRMEPVTVNGWEYVGFVGIPALEKELPIFSQWSYYKLKSAPCRYWGDMYTKDLVVMAHNYPTHFGGLADLRAGDTVTVTDMNAVTFTYEVVAVEALDPYATEDMIAGDYDLTLFTCTYGGESRVTVYCEKVTQ